jgi:hypothetical protein
VVSTVHKTTKQQGPHPHGRDDGRLMHSDLERLDAGVDPSQGLLDPVNAAEPSAGDCQSPPSQVCRGRRASRMGEDPDGRLGGLDSPSEEGIQHRPHPGQLQACGVIGDGGRDGVEHLLGLGGTFERESQSRQPGDRGLGSLGVAASHRGQLGIGLGTAA